MKALSRLARIAVVAGCAGVWPSSVVDIGHQCAEAAQAGEQLSSFVVHGDGSVPTPDSAAMDYANDLSTSTGASLHLALSFSLATAPWDRVVQTISDAEPDNDAGAYRTGVLDAGAHIAFVRQPSAATVATLSALPLDTTVVVGSPASARALADAANSADTIVKTVGLTPLSTDADSRSSTITVKVAAGGSSAQMQAGRTAVADAVATITGNSRIRADVVIGGAGDAYAPLSAITGGGKDLD